MVVEFLTGEEEMRAFAELLRPEPTADGFESEERLVICGVSWERYLALDKALGDDRPGPRFYFLDGELEIMTTSNEHERIKKWIGDLMAVYFEEASIEIMPRGQATMRKALKQAGAEPDESWCIDGEKEFPDLALEIALTTGGLSKLEIYRRFNVPEVWFWRRQVLESSRYATTAPATKRSRGAGCFRTSTSRCSSAAWRSVHGSRRVARFAPASAAATDP